MKQEIEFLARYVDFSSLHGARPNQQLQAGRRKNVPAAAFV
jgi:hypothetical protein